MVFSKMNPSFFVFFQDLLFLQQIWDNERKYHSLGGVFKEILGGSFCLPEVQILHFHMTFRPLHELGP